MLPRVPFTQVCVLSMEAVSEGARKVSGAHVHGPFSNATRAALFCSYKVVVNWSGVICPSVFPEGKHGNAFLTQETAVASLQDVSIFYNDLYGS